jgi:hypothetical protein
MEWGRVRSSKKHGLWTNDQRRLAEEIKCRLDVDVAIHCNHGDETLLSQEPCQVIIAWNRVLLSIDLVKCLTEYS